MTAAIAAVAGYLLGSIPSGYWLPLLFRREDIRTKGSGNMGAANVWRTFGLKLALSVALLDVAKGLVAALVGLWVGGGEWTGIVAGIAAMIGHYRPVFLRFERGGKTVATTGGVALALAPLAALASAGVWILVFVVGRYSSLASLSAAAALPILAWQFGAGWPVIAFTGAATAAIAVLHRANIARLLRGRESRFQFSRRQHVLDRRRQRSLARRPFYMRVADFVGSRGR
jgi:glycerol-3-phosphate acyltransferase PlsY